MKGSVVKARGLTLLELVIVIVIVTLLSIIVIPRIIDIKSLASAQVVRSTEGAIRSTSALFHAEAILKDVYDGSLNINGFSFDVRAGYIRGHWNRSWRFALDLGKDIGFTPPADVCEKNGLCGVGNQRPRDFIPAISNDNNR